MPNPILMRKLRPNRRGVCVFACTADNICRTADVDTVLADCGIDLGDSMAPYWTGIFENFESYAISVSGAYVEDGNLVRGDGWGASAYSGETSGRQIVAFDTLSDYSDGSSLIGLNGGQGWGGAWQ